MIQRAWTKASVAALVSVGLGAGMAHASNEYGTPPQDSQAQAQAQPAQAPAEAQAPAKAQAPAQPVQQVQPAQAPAEPVKPAQAPAEPVKPAQAPVEAAKPDPAKLAEAHKKLIGKMVVGQDGAAFGEVVNVASAADGKLQEVHVKTGGYFGFFTKTVKLLPAQFAAEGESLKLKISAEDAGKLPEVGATS